jgi:hypothetical protein
MSSGPASKDGGPRRYADRHGSRPSQIRLLSPEFVELPEEEAAEVVNLLADLIKDALRRRAKEHRRVDGGA